MMRSIFMIIMCKFLFVSRAIYISFAGPISRLYKAGMGDLVFKWQFDFHNPQGCEGFSTLLGSYFETNHFKCQFTIFITL